MQFQIPQFIETEDKIAGPLSLRQLGYFIAAGFISFMCYWVFATWLWFLITMIVGITAAAFAFISIIYL